MLFKSLFVLGALALSTAAMADALPDGTASFRIDNGAIVSFDYSADFGYGQLSGHITRNGTDTVRLTLGRAGEWTGNLGSVSVSASAASTDVVGTQSIEVRTLEGIFDYTVETAKNGDVEFRTVSPTTGELLTAGVEDHGTSFAVMTESLDMGLTQDSSCSFSGPATAFYGTEQANLDAQGSLALADLAKKDPSLFILLYVLPFDLGN